MKTSQNLLERTDKRAIGQIFPWNAHKNFTDVSETTTVQEAIEKSALNFTVRTEPLFLQDGRQARTKAIIRDDTNEIVSDGVGPDWTPVQNQAKFDWFNRYLEANQTKLLTAGYLGNGEKQCLIARLNHNTNVEITKGDEIAKYILLVDSFEPGKSMKLMLLMARLTCCNGNVGFNEENFRKIPHRRKINARMEDLHQDVMVWDKGFDTAVESARFLASHPVKTQSSLFDYYAKVMDFEEKANEAGQKEYSTRSKNTMERLNELFEDDKYNGSSRSWWNSFNAVTAYLNHESGRSADTALDSLWFGQSNVRTKKAWNLALEYATAA